MPCESHWRSPTWAHEKRLSVSTLTLSVVMTRRFDPGESAPKVRLRKVDEFVAASAQHSLQHEKREALGHFQGDRRRHRELRPGHHGMDENRPVMGESGGDAVVHLASILESDSLYADGFCHLREIRVLEVGAEIKEP